MKKLYILLILILSSTLTAKQKEVVCIGDSITEGYGIPKAQRKQYSWPSVLGKLLGDKYNVTNLGACSRTLCENTAKPWSTIYKKTLMKLKPDLFIFMLGTNDSKLKNWKGNEQNFEKDLLNYIKLMRNLNKKAQIFICLPPPAFQGKKLSKGDSISGERIKKEIIPIIKKVAEKDKKIKIIDLFSAMLKHPDYFSDGVHPNIKGANFLSNYIFKQINKYLKTEQ